MSVFKVQLNNPQQGQLDYDPASATPVLIGGAQGDEYLGGQMDPSIQRTVRVAGPNRIYRVLKDGEQFTDCNYWKRFAYPQLPLDQAFITVMTDDGSVWSDYSNENSYVVTFGGSTSYTVGTSDTFTTKYIDIIGTYGSYATSVQITNNGTNNPNQNIKVQLNGSTNAVFVLNAGDTQIFDTLQVSKLAFQGGTSSTTLQIILTLVTQCNS